MSASIVRRIYCGSLLMAAFAGVGLRTAAFAGVSEIDVRVAAPDTVLVGDPVPIHVVATNHSASNVTRILRMDGEILSRPAFDVAIVNARGQRVWHRRKLPPAIPGAISIFPPGEKVVDLAPGQTLEWSAIWDQRDDAGAPVAAGEYFLTAIIPEASGIQLESVRRRLIILGRPPSRHR
ncbi:MAG TPA: hypothetical protein VK636_16365 [Gemmatimonadaceae bacterium]|nr:hypothetical protein [Gemmatimonadaceae bacterium]